MQENPKTNPDGNGVENGKGKMKGLLGEMDAQEKKIAKSGDNGVEGYKFENADQSLNLLSKDEDSMVREIFSNLKEGDEGLSVKGEGFNKMTDAQKQTLFLELLKMQNRSGVGTEDIKAVNVRIDEFDAERQRVNGEVTVGIGDDDFVYYQDIRIGDFIVKPE